MCISSTHSPSPNKQAPDSSHILLAAWDAAFARYFGESGGFRGVRVSAGRRRRRRRSPPPPPTTKKTQKLARAPTAAAVIERLFSDDNNGGWGAASLRHDHVAFRTYGVPGLGIDSLGAVLTGAFGYSRREPYQFAAKKLDATWFAPPSHLADALPRVFVSELRVRELSPAAQAAVRRYTDPLSTLDPAAAWTSALAGGLPWAAPRHEDYELLLGESEYAAW